MAAKKSEAAAESTPDAAPPPEPPPPEPPPAPAPADGLLRGKVWEHGALHYNGKVFPPSAAVELPADIAAQVGEVFIPSK